ncbi:DUF4397 domain-containing protein [Arcticibacter sp. MXS-1]|uniref:DUF4397 domain-containing protein n=1 Tax=Arcticibacter sp. MXS-1 TaxID=3341726 RepID=UPI0035A871A8
MKLNNYLPEKFRFISSGLILLGVTMLFSACLKSNDNDNYKPVLSDVMIVNADPNITSAEFAYGGQRTEYNIGYSTNSKYYKDLFAGVEMVFFKGSSNTVVARGAVPAGADSVFSIYLAGSGDSSFVVADKLVSPSGTNAAIRFVNASKSAGSVDVSISTATAKLTAQGFSGASGAASPTFKEYPAGQTVVNVYAAGTETPLVTTPLTFNAVAGVSYTVYLRGVKDGQGAKQLGLGLVDHKSAL